MRSRTQLALAFVADLFKLIIVSRCREKYGVHLLTVKCFRPYERNVKSGLKAYDSNVSRIWTNLTKKLKVNACINQI